MISTIIFDVSEVLFQGLLGFEKVLSARLGQQVPDNLLWEQKEVQEFFRGQRKELPMWQAVIDRYDWNTDPQELHGLVRQYFTPIQGTIDVARELRQAGFMMGIISVHGREWVHFLDTTWTYHEVFDHQSYSFQSGHLKPETGAFMASLAGLNRIKPTGAGNCLFIDDSPVNIDAAKRLGFRAVLFRNAAQLRHELAEKHGLLS